MKLSYEKEKKYFLKLHLRFYLIQNLINPLGISRQTRRGNMATYSTHSFLRLSVIFTLADRTV